MTRWFRFPTFKLCEILLSQKHKLYKIHTKIVLLIIVFSLKRRRLVISRSQIQYIWTYNFSLLSNYIHMHASDRNLQNSLLKFLQISQRAHLSDLYTWRLHAQFAHMCTALHMYLCTDVETFSPILGYTRKKRSKLNYHAFSLNIFVAFSMALAWPGTFCLPACRVVMGVIKSKKCGMYCRQTVQRKCDCDWWMPAENKLIEMWQRCKKFQNSP